MANLRPGQKDRPHVGYVFPPKSGRAGRRVRTIEKVWYERLAEPTAKIRISTNRQGFGACGSEDRAC